MKTFADLNNAKEVILAIYEVEGGYSFPRPHHQADPVWAVHDAVVESRTFYTFRDNTCDLHHGMLQHFGCLDAFLD